MLQLFNEILLEIIVKSINSQKLNQNSTSREETMSWQIAQLFIIPLWTRGEFEITTNAPDSSPHEETA